jgi:hypothetical protein
VKHENVFDFGLNIRNSLVAEGYGARNERAIIAAETGL